MEVKNEEVAERFAVLKGKFAALTDKINAEGRRGSR
jgi:hypothetical protein